MISDDDVSDDKCRKMASENYAELYGKMFISFAVCIGRIQILYISYFASYSRICRHCKSGHNNSNYARRLIKLNN